MVPDVGTRFWVNTVLAMVTAAMSGITLIWHDWIEIVFGVEPDHGSGWLEALILVSGLGVSLTFSASVYAEWRRRPLSDPSR